MNNSALVLVWGGASVLVSFLVSLLSPRALSIVTYPFSFKTFGIRRIRRLNSKTDSVANFFLLVSAIFCIGYLFIPYFYYVYGLYLIFSWLCALSRVPRMSAVKSRSQKGVVTFFITLVFGLGLTGSLGLMDRFNLIKLSLLFRDDLLAGSIYSIMYPLTHAALFAWIAQGLLMMIPLWFLWSQFKTMRLENSFRARNIFFFGLKGFLVAAAVLFLGAYGADGLRTVYRMEETNDESTAGERADELIDQIDEDIEEEQKDVQDEQEVQEEKENTDEQPADQKNEEEQ